MLRIAIQSKGRLNERSSALLREMGIGVDDSGRQFIYKASDFPVEILYMRDDDIPGIVAAGTASLGIVGLNEVEESGCDVRVVRKLGFGGCRISIAVPKTAGYTGLDWLEGKRIATSYPRLLKRFLDQRGIHAQTEVITGSVEIAPAAGIADAIFDIVSSGGTLLSNGLSEVERAFESEAVLIADKSLRGEDAEALDEILFRLDSAMGSRKMKYLLMNIPEEALEKAKELLPAMRSPTVMPLVEKGWYSMHSVVAERDLWTKVRQLKAIGAEGILVLGIDKIIP